MLVVIALLEPAEQLPDALGVKLRRVLLVVIVHQLHAFDEADKRLYRVVQLSEGIGLRELVHTAAVVLRHYLDHALDCDGEPRVAHEVLEDIAAVVYDPLVVTELAEQIDCAVLRPRADHLGEALDLKIGDIAVGQQVELCAALFHPLEALLIGIEQVYHRRGEFYLVAFHAGSLLSTRVSGEPSDPSFFRSSNLAGRGRWQQAYVR